MPKLNEGGECSSIINNPVFDEMHRAMALKALDQRMAAAPAANGPTTSGSSRSGSISSKPSIPAQKTEVVFNAASDDEGDNDNARA